MELLQAVSPYLKTLDLCDVDHRGWNFLQLETWFVKALMWSSTHDVGVVGLAEETTFSIPGYLLPHLQEFGIRFPGARKDVAIDYQKLGAVMTMVESRCPTNGRCMRFSLSTHSN
jgi:hypothetical protein